MYSNKIEQLYSNNVNNVFQQKANFPSLLSVSSNSHLNFKNDQWKEPETSCNMSPSFTVENKESKLQFTEKPKHNDNEALSRNLLARRNSNNNLKHHNFIEKRSNIYDEKTEEIFSINQETEKILDSSTRASLFQTIKPSNFSNVCMLCGSYLNDEASFVLCARPTCRRGMHVACILSCCCFSSPGYLSITLELCGTANMCEPTKHIYRTDTELCGLCHLFVYEAYRLKLQSEKASSEFQQSSELLWHLRPNTSKTLEPFRTMATQMLKSLRVHIPTPKGVVVQAESYIWRVAADAVKKKCARSGLDGCSFRFSAAGFFEARLYAIMRFNQIVEEAQGNDVNIFKYPKPVKAALVSDCAVQLHKVAEIQKRYGMSLKRVIGNVISPTELPSCLLNRSVEDTAHLIYPPNPINWLDLNLSQRQLTPKKFRRNMLLPPGKSKKKRARLSNKPESLQSSYFPLPASTLLQQPFQATPQASSAEQNQQNKQFFGGAPPIYHSEYFTYGSALPFINQDKQQFKPFDPGQYMNAPSVGFNPSESPLSYAQQIAYLGYPSALHPNKDPNYFNPTSSQPHFPIQNNKYYNQFFKTEAQRPSPSIVYNPAFTSAFRFSPPTSPHSPVIPTSPSFYSLSYSQPIRLEKNLKSPLTPTLKEEKLSFKTKSESLQSTAHDIKNESQEEPRQSPHKQEGFALSLQNIVLNVPVPSVSSSFGNDTQKDAVNGVSPILKFSSSGDSYSPTQKILLMENSTLLSDNPLSFSPRSADSSTSLEQTSFSPLHNIQLASAAAAKNSHFDSTSPYYSAINEDQPSSWDFSLPCFFDSSLFDTELDYESADNFYDLHSPRKEKSQQEEAIGLFLPATEKTLENETVTSLPELSSPVSHSSITKLSSADHKAQCLANNQQNDETKNVCFKRCSSAAISKQTSNVISTYAFSTDEQEKEDSLVKSPSVSIRTPPSNANIKQVLTSVLDKNDNGEQNIVGYQTQNSTGGGGVSTPELSGLHTPTKSERAKIQKRDNRGRFLPVIDKQFSKHEKQKRLKSRNKRSLKNEATKKNLEKGISDKKLLTWKDSSSPVLSRFIETNIPDNYSFESYSSIDEENFPVLVQ